MFVHTGVRVHRWARLRTQTGMMSACTEKQGLSAQGAPATPLCTLSALCGRRRFAHSVDVHCTGALDELYLHRYVPGTRSAHYVHSTLADILEYCARGTGYYPLMSLLL